MPKIRTYDNPVQGFQASNAAANAAVQAGESIARSYSQIGENIGGGLQDLGKTIDAVDTRNEMSKLTAGMATTQADLTVGWNQTAQSADPNATDTASNYMENVVDPALEKLGDGLTTPDAKAKFQEMSATVRAGLFEKTAADQATLAGNAAVDNAKTVSNQLAGVAYTDPTSAQSAMILGDQAVDALRLSHGLPAEKADDLKRDLFNGIAVSAIRGTAEKNPDAALQMLNSGAYSKFLTDKDQASLRSDVGTYQKAQTNAQKAAVVAQEKADKDKFDQVLTKTTSSLIDPTTGSVAVPPDYFINIARASNMPGADRSATAAAINMGRSVLEDQQKGTPAITDPHTYEDFRNRMFLPDTDPNKLTVSQVLQARADHLLSDKDFTFYSNGLGTLQKNPQQAVADKDFGEFLKSYKNYITDSSYLKINAYGDQKYYEWSTNAQQMRATMEAQKKPEAEIRKAIVATIPKYQLTEKQNSDAVDMKVQKGLQPLPMTAPTVPRVKWTPGMDLNALDKQNFGGH